VSWWNRLRRRHRDVQLCRFSGLVRGLDVKIGRTASNFHGTKLTHERAHPDQLDAVGDRRPRVEPPRRDPRRRPQLPAGRARARGRGNWPGACARSREREIVEDICAFRTAPRTTETRTTANQYSTTATPSGRATSRYATGARPVFTCRTAVRRTRVAVALICHRMSCLRACARPRLTVRVAPPFRVTR